MAEPVRDPSGRVVYAPFDKQVAYHESAARYRLFGGSKGCGKSLCLRWDHHLFHLAVPGSRGLITRRQLTELQRSHIAELPKDIQAMGGEAAGFRWAKSELGAGVLYYPNGSALEFGHLQYDESVDQYLSAQYTRISMDEIVTNTEHQHLMLCSCLRTTIPGIIPQFGAATNPGGKYGRWVRRRWVDKDLTPEEDEVYDPRDYHYIPALPKDNPHLNWAEYQRELSRLPAALRAAYRDGSWDSFEGQFFPEFQKATHVLTPAEVRRYALDRSYRRDIGMQWGYQQTGGAVVVVLAPDGTLVVEDELPFNGPQREKRVASEVAAAVLERVAERGWAMRRWLLNPQTGDGRGHDDGETVMETFRRTGVPARAADDDRINGWNRLRAWLRVNPVTGKPYLRVHPRCRQTILALGDLVEHDDIADEVDREGPEALPNALRFVVMSRPSPARELLVPSFLPGTVGAMREAAMAGHAGPTRLGESHRSKRRGV